MNKRVLLGVIVSFLLVLVCAAILALRRVPAGNADKRVGALQSLVAQNLKPGVSPDQVIRFLDVQHLEHSELIKPEAMRFGSQNYANENVIAAIKRNTSISMLVSESIQLIFVFNENHGLVRCDVFPIYTGP